MGNGRSFTRNLQPVDPPAPDPGVRPSAVPMSTRLSQFQGPDGSIGVAFEVSTPVGVSVYFLTPEGAKSLGQQLVSMGTAGSAGLVVPA